MEFALQFSGKNKKKKTFFPFGRKKSGRNLFLPGGKNRDFYHGFFPPRKKHVNVGWWKMLSITKRAMIVYSVKKKERERERFEVSHSAFLCLTQWKKCHIYRLILLAQSKTTSIKCQTLTLVLNKYSLSINVAHIVYTGEKSLAHINMNTVILLKTCVDRTTSNSDKYQHFQYRQ